MLCKHEWVEVPEAGTKRRFVFRCSHCTAIFWLVFDGPALRVHVEDRGSSGLWPSDVLAFVDSLLAHHGIRRVGAAPVFLDPSPVPPAAPAAPVKRRRRAAVVFSTFRGLEWLTARFRGCFVWHCERYLSSVNQVCASSSLMVRSV